MGIYFLDSSALVKRYVSETVSSWVIHLLNPVLDHDVFIAAIALAETYQLRGYDAVQLAAATAVNQLCTVNGLASIIFVSADNELNAAAVREGLTIENPNDYP